MKKVITVHISGLLFHMEEDAFATMRESLFRQGKQGDHATEVLIAEKFNLLLSPGKQVVTLADVQAVLPQLGFKLSYDTSAHYNDMGEKKIKNIYRINQGKVLGGVCTGFGEYWGIDPVILRILFVILFFGFGAGLLFYLLLWIILPIKK